MSCFHHLPQSRYHTFTVHAAGAALIRGIQLAQLMLPDLPHQGVEGILNSLGKRSMAWSSYPLLGGTVEGGKDTSKVSLTLSSSADSRVKGTEPGWED